MGPVWHSLARLMEGLLISPPPPPPRHWLNSARVVSILTIQPEEVSPIYGDVREQLILGEASLHIAIAV